MVNNKTLSSGIYKVVNLITGRSYVGSAINLRSRRCFHFSEAQHNKHLKRSMKKYGFENFKFEVLEYCEKDKLIEREQYYLDTLLFAQEYIRSNHKDKRFEELGYNANPTAESRLGTKHTLKARRKMSKNNWMNGKHHTDEWKKKMISTKFKNGTNIQTTETKQKISIAHRGKPKSESHKQVMRENNKKKWKAILQYDLDGNFIAEYPSITIATQTISKQNNIPEGLLNIVGVAKGTTKYSKGFVFKYKHGENYPLKIDVDLSPVYSQDSKERQKQKAKLSAAKRKKAIILYDRFTGNFIAEYGGMMECEKATGIETQRLRAVLQGRSKYTHDKIVRYKTDNYPTHISPVLNQYTSEQSRREGMKRVWSKNSQPILAYDLKGRLINEYPSANEAALKLGIGIQNAGGIRMVLHGRAEQCKGYKFKYKDPNYTPKKYKPRQQVVSIN